MVNAIPTANTNRAGFVATVPLIANEVALRGGLSGPNRGRGVSYFTLRWLSKKCMGTKGVQREHAHASAKTGITSQFVALL